VLLLSCACGADARPYQSASADTVAQLPLNARLDSLMAPLVASHEFSGAVVLARHDSTLYARGFGIANRDSAAAFTPDTPSDGASLARTFTAAGVWWLVSEGKIDPAARVRRYVAEYPHAATTVRQLIGHADGLPDDYAFFDAHFTDTQARTIEAMLRVLARHAPAPSFAPGTRFEYSSLGYDVAALLIERVTGQRYEQFLQRRFFTPLEMSSSFVRPARLADWRGTRTRGYRWRDTSWIPVEVFDMEAFRGGSNIYFSARDVSRWANAHAGGRAMPAEVLAAGASRVVVAAERTALTELNWYCDATGDRCYYTGDLNAFFSFVYWDRARGESAVFVSNSALPMWRRAELARDSSATCFRSHPTCSMCLVSTGGLLSAKRRSPSSCT